MPLIAAGGTFTGASLAGLLVGVAVSARTGNQLWAVAGLFLGLAVGAYGAVRLLMRVR